MTSGQLKRTRSLSRDSGTVLAVVLCLSLVLAFAVTVLLEQAQTQAKATRIRSGSIRALYEAFGELEAAKTVIGEAEYDRAMKNEVVKEALARPDRTIPGTRVTVDRMTGAAGSWYVLTARIPYADDYERIVRQAFREIDFFSSYNLFVSEDPAGISGAPIGAIHTNEQIQFYFPGGAYRHSVTAVDGHAFKSGATEENTRILGPWDDGVDRIPLDYGSADRFNLDYIAANVAPSMRFDDSLDTRLRLYANGREQWVRIERWTKPEVRRVEYQELVGYDLVNPREEEYRYVERVSRGFETRTRQVQVLDRVDTVLEDVRVPVFVDDVRTVPVPVYRTETASREVQVYRTETRYRAETRQVWVPADGSSGGTTVVGDEGSVGFWMPQEVQVPYTVQVPDRVEVQTYPVQVLAGYEDRQETYRRLDREEIVQKPKSVPVYRTQEQTYQVEVFEDVSRTGVRTVHDKVPKYRAATRTDYVRSRLASQRDEPVPENGLIYCDGDVLDLRGDVIERLTVASAGSITIGGDLIYRDHEGDTAYLNGDKPWLPYEPNPHYDNFAILGVIAREDVLYGRSMPDNSQINCSILAMTGRVGIEGVSLDDVGEVVGFNQLTDEFGRATGTRFQKNSIRRLGGVTTARRPVETVVKEGRIVSGFNVGQSVFDIGLLEGPPPFFLAYPVPRFFATVIER